MIMHKESLAKLYGRYEMRSQSLNARFAAKLPADTAEKAVCAAIHQDGRAYSVIRLQLLWGEFCKELIVKSAIGGCITRTNQTLDQVPSVKKVSDIPGIIKLKDLASPATKWEEPQFAINQASVLKVKNINSIQLGLGGASMVAGNIKCVRNYLVHPNRNNRNKYIDMIRALGFRDLPPDQLLFQAVVGGETVFENWLSTLSLAAWNAVA